VEKLLEVVG